MNEQSNKILVELLQKAANGIDAAVSFSQAQIPEVVHQLLVWKFTKSMMLTLVILATIPVAIKFFRVMMKREQDGVYGEEGYSWERGKPKYRPTLVWDKDGTISASSVFFGTIMFLYSVIAFVILSDMTWLKIWLAPKLYLLEYAASLIK
ncbi:hypothetical protein ACFW0K_004429 [Enterobacter hormaechei]|uniref:Uncharacterized protein n=1 Tax=Salmonella senftenberg TaxID=28150 RepID=A0A726A0A8_SALSE|nr:MULTISPECIES: hypothetical protein [Enterobacteriaceae]EAY2050211.1 hypothetical protein [Salmonella enterica]ECC3099167.1 hypothetical protein [Salmonella enterica subsp. enterica]HAE1058533.1 hypothetical protein [Salmonella enterica subsp. enterica serovar Senftenberg]EDZ0847813.1 hypothetical protein [Salmonella enterica]EIT2969323.1 hypothetical protein [Salmonella enterica]